MPGEHRGCIGCHENRELPWAPRYPNPSPLAMRHDPSIPERLNWGTDGIIDFPRVVQPVLDKYCVKCHSGSTPQGAVDLTGDKTRFFSESYDNLIERGPGRLPSDPVRGCRSHDAAIGRIVAEPPVRVHRDR